MNMTSNMRRAVLAGVVTASMLGGGVIGATAFRATSVFAASNTGVTTGHRAAASPGASRAPGVFTSNEDPAHEATESAAREAQEDAGQKPTVP
jgi:hypothetical protein